MVSIPIVLGLLSASAAALGAGEGATAGSSKPDHSTRRPDTYVVRASGLLMGSDYSRPGWERQVFPLVHVRVDIMNSNNPGSLIHFGDDVMGTGFTDENGVFSIEGRGKDWLGFGDDAKPDVYARVALNDGEGVRVVTELNDDWTDNTPEHDNDNVEGTFYLGNFTFGSRPNEGGSTQGIYDGARRAYKDYLALGLGTPPYGTYTIIRYAAWPYGTPWTSLDTTHWPTTFHTANGVCWHEFGHSLRHTFDAPNNNFDHWLADAAKYDYARVHHPTDKTNQGFAFNEGWAEFWSGEFPDQGLPGTWAASQDMEVEGNVATALSILAASTIDPGNGSPQPAGRVAMIQVLRDNPGTIHSYADFETAFHKKFPAKLASRIVAKTPAELAVDRQVAEALQKLRATYLGASTGGVSGESPEQEAAQTKAVTDRLQELAAQRTAIQELVRTTRARLDAPGVASTDLYEGRRSLAAMNAELRLVDAAGKDLQEQHSPAFRDGFKQRLADGTLDQWCAKNKESQRALVKQTYSAALDEMDTALKNLKLATDEDTAVAVRGEHERLAAIRALVEKDRVPAPGVKPASDAARRRLE